MVCFRIRCDDRLAVWLTNRGLSDVKTRELSSLQKTFARKVIVLFTPLITRNNFIAMYQLTDSKNPPPTHLLRALLIGPFTVDEISFSLRHPKFINDPGSPDINILSGIFLMVQWLRLPVPTVGGPVHNNHRPQNPLTLQTVVSLRPPVGSGFIKTQFSGQKECNVHLPVY